jgi:S1-C subfamily serine protease
MQRTSRHQMVRWPGGGAVAARRALATALALALMGPPAAAGVVLDGSRLAQSTPSPGAPATATPPAVELRVEALRRAHVATLGVRTRTVEDARSNETLGPYREGSGVVIGADGLVLTINYLVLEAETVELEIEPGRVVPARVLANDIATGFALLMPLVPIRVEPVPLGRSSQVQRDQPLLFSSSDAVSMARLVTRRPFSGSWEYHLDSALFTAPARQDHSGAGLFNADGELVGIGSLVVRDTGGEGGGWLPGNMFVPVDLLGPILDELKTRGSSAQSMRAWLGVNCAERDGQVRILRVNRESPAEEAGLRVGDRIASIDGRDVDSLESLYKALWAGGDAQRDVKLGIRRDGELTEVTVKTIDRLSTLRRSRGI